MLDLFGARANEKRIDLAYFYDAHTPVAIISDPTRIRQVLVNLVGNALKFTEKGEVVVEIDCERIAELPQHCEYLQLLAKGPAEEGFCRLQFQVRDTGLGIPAERLHRLFKPFSQVDASVSRKFGGTGLGLVIARRLVETMGGKIWVESTPGMGTSFFFTIHAKATSSRRSVNFFDASTALKDKRVLIVDDGEINCQILRLQTQRWGMVPQVFTNPAHALSWLEENPPVDVGVFDYYMPEMDGLQFAQQGSRAGAFQKSAHDFTEFLAPVQNAEGLSVRSLRRAIAQADQAIGSFPSARLRPRSGRESGKTHSLHAKPRPHAGVAPDFQDSARGRQCD